MPVHVIGACSNLIVRDGGLPGVVIRLSPRAFGETKTDGDIVAVGSDMDVRGGIRTGSVLIGEMTIAGN